MKMRPLTNTERNILILFANKIESLSLKQQFLEDIEKLSVLQTNSDHSITVYHIQGYDRPPSGGQKLFGVEGRALDRDATDLTVLIYADQNGRILEQEIIRWDDKDLIAPDWGTLQLF